MNKFQEQLLSLLSIAIGQNSITSFTTDAIDWKELYAEAKVHAIHGLIYPLLNKYKNKLNPDKETFEELQRFSITNAIVQKMNMQLLRDILIQFNELNISIILLKGIVLREFYPYPELRTMGDIDLLVKPNDLERSVALIKKFGYIVSTEHTDIKHTMLVSDSKIIIEVHTAITYPKEINHVDTDSFETHLWNNAINANVNGIETLALSPTDQLIHIFLHMAHHILSSGFGLRHLCDLIFFVNANRTTIDWDNFYKSIEAFKLDGFVSSTFILCHKYLNMDISYIKINSTFNDALLNNYMDDILFGGVFGFRDSNRLIAGKQMKFSSRKDPQLKRYLSNAFPKADKLVYKYPYIKKYPYLFWIAWFQLLFYFIRRKDYTVKEKLSYIFPSKAMNTVFNERAELLNWLGLR